MANLDDRHEFWFYNDLDGLEHEPHTLSVQFDDDLMVADEVYSRIAFLKPKLR